MSRRGAMGMAVLMAVGAIAMLLAAVGQMKNAGMRPFELPEALPHYLGREGYGAPPIAIWHPRTMVLTITEHGQRLGITCERAPVSAP